MNISIFVLLFAFKLVGCMHRTDLKLWNQSLKLIAARSDHDRSSVLTKTSTSTESGDETKSMLKVYSSRARRGKGFKLLERKSGKLLRKIFGLGNSCSDSCCKHFGASCCNGASSSRCCQNHRHATHMEFPDDGLEPIEMELQQQQIAANRRAQPPNSFANRRKSGSTERIVFFGKLNSPFAASPSSSSSPLQSIDGFIASTSHHPGPSDDSTQQLGDDINYLRTVAERLRPLMTLSSNEQKYTQIPLSVASDTGNSDSQSIASSQMIPQNQGHSNNVIQIDASASIPPYSPAHVSDTPYSPTGGTIKSTFSNRKMIRHSN